ncbi:hypothetical protein FRB97_003851 [Tulasnella sp. 331]|nr:hypothetical protein FRB97_003851 [Tulasnella sp. 331]
MLPFDICTVIARCCSRRALLSLCLVSKAFNAASTIQLYKDLFTLLDTGNDDRPRGTHTSVQWRKLCQVLSEDAHLQDCVRKFVPARWSATGRQTEGGIQVEEMVLSRLKNLKEVVFELGDSAQVGRFITHCASVNIHSITLPRRIDNLPKQPFWTWMESQKEVRDLTLPWKCDLSGMSPLALPRLKNLGATVEATKILVRNRLIRSYDGIATHVSIPLSLWSLADLQEVIPQFGKDFYSIGGLKLLGCDVPGFLRLLRAFCPMIKTIHYLIDGHHDNASSTPGTNLDHIVSALQGFSRLEDLYLAIDHQAEEHLVLATILKISQACPKLRLVQWTHSIPHGDAFKDHIRIEYTYAFVEGSWKQLQGSDYLPVCAPRIIVFAQ